MRPGGAGFQEAGSRDDLRSDLLGPVSPERMWEEAGEQESEDEEAPEEALRPRRVPGEERPGEQEVQEHMMTHVPLRSRCPFCVSGKAGSNPHRRKEEGRPGVPAQRLQRRGGLDPWPS